MSKIFKTGAQYPPAKDIERLAKYKRMRKLFDAKPQDIYERATQILKDRPQSAQLEQLYIAVNLADIIATKPADMLIGDMPAIESGKDDMSTEQQALNSYVENNKLQQLIHESAIGAGYRGDAWLKVRYGYREDYSELLELSGEGAIPEGVELEPIVEHVDANTVFPELAQGESKRFKAINIAQVIYDEVPKLDDNGEITYKMNFTLDVERHIPGAIIYEQYRLHRKSVNVEYGEDITVYTIGEQLGTTEIEHTKIPHIPIFHIPYKSTDRSWEGIGGLEKVERIFYAINDRLTQIDYILWKHSDPNAYGPPIESDDTTNARFGGMYYEIKEGDVIPGYMTWDAQLDAAFKELDMLISLVFMNAETPQWVFGTVLAGDQKGGTGTSHTDGAAIKSRFMPILSKVARIRTRYDQAIRDAMLTCYLFEANARKYSGEIVRPTIKWKDGLPKNEKEEAEIMMLRTGSLPTIDQHSAIKRLDEVDDNKASEVLRRIGEDEERTMAIDDVDFFNKPIVPEETEVKDDGEKQ